MSTTRAALRTLSKSIAQDPANTAKLLLTDPGDYNTAIDLAVPMFSIDKPNRRIIHYTAAAVGFRFVLFGSGTILTGGDAWIDGATTLEAVYLGYDTTSDQNEPLDRQQWRIRREPGPLEVLELRGLTISTGQILRLETLAPHSIHESDAAQSSVRAGDVTALGTLVAYHLCQMTARRYVQNTGTSSFQNESVDRRTQSDMMAARAKDLLSRYGEMVGKAPEESLAAAGIRRTLEIDTSHRRGRLWPH